MTKRLHGDFVEIERRVLIGKISDIDLIELMNDVQKFRLWWLWRTRLRLKKQETDEE